MLSGTDVTFPAQLIYYLRHLSLCCCERLAACDKKKYAFDTAVMRAGAFYLSSRFVPLAFSNAGDSRAEVEVHILYVLQRGGSQKELFFIKCQVIFILRMPLKPYAARDGISFTAESVLLSNFKWNAGIDENKDLI